MLFRGGGTSVYTIHHPSHTQCTRAPCSSSIHHIPSAHVHLVRPLHIPGIDIPGTWYDMIRIPVIFLCHGRTSVLNTQHTTASPYALERFFLCHLLLILPVSYYTNVTTVANTYLVPGTAVLILLIRTRYLVRATQRPSYDLVL